MPTARRPSTDLARLHRSRNNTDSNLNTVARETATTSSALVAGTLYLSMFTPAVDLTFSKIGAASGTTAWVSPTLVRLGLYALNDDGTVTLVAATANTPTMFAATNSFYSAPLDSGGGLPTTYTLAAGRRYAVGVLGVGGTIGHVRMALPTLTLAIRPPIMAGTVGTGLTDLPVGPVAITAWNGLFWAELAV